jgi:hypothetical protein
MAPPIPPDFRADERGAFMVMGIFMSLFLVAALWSIAGTGEAVLFRERLQQASDAAALGAASIDARAMNLVVLFNIVAASIMSVRIAMVAMLIVGGAISSPSYVPLPAFKPLAAPINQLLYKPYDSGITTAINALNTAQRTIMNTAPAAAAKNAVDMSARYEPTVNSTATIIEGTPVGPGGHLPGGESVQGGDDGLLCDAASDLALPNTPALFSPMTAPAPLVSAIMSKIGSTLSPADVWTQIVDSGDWYQCELTATSTASSFDFNNTGAKPGFPDTQIFASVGARSSVLPMGAALVDLAAQGHHNTPNLNLAKNAAFSETEFFFDCPNVWVNGCQFYADWTVAWATRLRLFNINSARTATNPAGDLADAVGASGQALQNSLSADVTAAGTNTNASSDVLTGLGNAQLNQLPVLH